MLCAPSLYRAYLRNKDKLEDLNFALFEYDKRFSTFGEAFNFYDLNNPLEIDARHHKKYDIIEKNVEVNKEEKNTTEEKMNNNSVQRNNPKSSRKYEINIKGGKYENIYNWTTSTRSSGCRIP